MRFALLLLSLLLTALPTARAQDAAAWGMVMQVAAPAADPVWDSLVAYYPLDGTATDSITSSNGTWGADVVETNDVPFAAAGTAASLNRAANAYVTTVNAALLHGESAFTLAGWAKVRSYNFVGGLFYSHSVAQGYFGLRQYTSSETVFSGLYTQAGNTPGAAVEIVNGDWFHISQTYTKDSTSKLYINGILQDESAPNAGTVYQTAAILIGYDASSAARKTDGVCDEWGVWNRELTSNEVYRIYSEQLTYP